MSVSTANKIILSVGLSGFAGLFIWYGVALYFAYTKLDQMLKLLKNCPAVMNRTIFLNSGPWWRVFVLGGVISLMVTPRIYLRDGGADPEDLNNFPADLRRKLIILHWTGWVPLLVLFGLFGATEFGLL